MMWFEETKLQILPFCTSLQSGAHQSYWVLPKLYFWPGLLKPPSPPRWCYMGSVCAATSGCVVYREWGILRECTRNMCTHTHIYIYVYIYLCIYIYKQLYVYIYVCMYVYIYRYHVVDGHAMLWNMYIGALYIYAYTYMYIIYIYTFIDFDGFCYVLGGNGRCFMEFR